MINWRIYYGDGSTFDNLHGMAEDAPAWNVQIINQRHEAVGVRRQFGADYYLFIDGQWVGLDARGSTIGLVDHLTNVLDVLSYDTQGIRTVYSIKRDGEWLEVDCFQSAVLHFIDQGLIKVGRMMPHARWYEIKQAVINDPDFPKKNSRLPREPEL